MRSREWNNLPLTGGAIMPTDVMDPLQFNTESIEAFCNRWKISELSLFGSALRADFRPDSDVDILVQFARDASWGLLDLAAMERELADILGRSVDIVTRGSLERSRNEIFRAHVLAHVLSNVRPIFLAGRQVHLGYTRVSVADPAIHRPGDPRPFCNKRSTSRCGDTSLSDHRRSSAPSQSRDEVRYAVIRWSDILGMRHRLVHDYIEVDLDIVWNAVRVEVPQLLLDLDRIAPPG